eukprot:342410-Rhodomonas_salina.2
MLSVSNLGDLEVGIRTKSDLCDLAVVKRELGIRLFVGIPRQSATVLGIFGLKCRLILGSPVSPIQISAVVPGKVVGKPKPILYRLENGVEIFEDCTQPPSKGDNSATVHRENGF